MDRTTIKKKRIADRRKKIKVKGTMPLINDKIICWIIFFFLFFPIIDDLAVLLQCMAIKLFSSSFPMLRLPVRILSFDWTYKFFFVFLRYVVFCIFQPFLHGILTVFCRTSIFRSLFDRYDSLRSCKTQV